MPWAHRAIISHTQSYKNKCYLSYQLHVEFKVRNQACPKLHMVYPYMNQAELPQLLACLIYILGVGHRITILQKVSGFF
jgi:hypothetical protein